jgi:type II secretory pathway pseudopilin PulG
MIDVFLEAAHESYTRLRKQGLRGLDFRGWTILLGFLLILLVIVVGIIGIAAG